MAQDTSAELSVLDMPHITQSTEDAKKAIQKRIEKMREEKAEGLDDPKLQEKYTFDFEFTDGRGHRWTGKFQNRILTMVDRQTLGALQAQWQLGMAHRAFDPDISAMNYVLAHMTVSLEILSGAEWAKDLRKLTNNDLVQALYAEVSAHEATFHGRIPPTKAGEKGDGV